MNKLGIITFHSSHNEGAVLQCLALSRHLANLLPDWKVEVVDAFYARKQAWYEQTKDGRALAIERFARTGLPLSERQYVLNGSLGRESRAIAEEYQALVYGSDEIWKLHYKPHFFGLWKRQSHPFYPAFPNIYWPLETSRVAQFAYAICVGDTVFDGIPARHRAAMRRMMHSLALIGVRDRIAQNFVLKLDPSLGALTSKVPDPTFAVPLVTDAIRRAVSTKLAGFGVDFTRPTVAIVARESDDINAVVEHFRTTGYQSVAFTLPNSRVDVDLSSQDINPVEWMAGLSLFSVCISERMHACISCLRGGTPVIAIDHHIDATHPASKLQDLFLDFELSAFHYSVHRQSREDLLKAVDLVTQSWPSSDVQAKVRDFEQRSLSFGQQIRKSLHP